ncbi:MAG: hypothetical protein MUF27_07760 [Acidobacteria bacterium]|jgi:hypothetical protein|nr:hypothetical protein [Acidobacteriota bacterium]
MIRARFSRIPTGLAAAVLTLMLSVPGASALAHGHRHHPGHGHGHGRGAARCCGRPAVRPPALPRPVAVPAAFVVPPRLTPAFVYSARTYLAGDFWYRPHGHRHVVYSFPVVAGGRAAYRPHVYCGGVLVRDAWMPEDDGWLQIGLSLPGLSITAGLPLDD